MALRVLLADESSTIKRVMQLALQDYAVEVRAVPVGIDVLPVAKNYKPDLIFVDVLLPKKPGYEVARELKNDPELKHIPVVLMWSGFMELDEAKAAQAQVDRRLEKPFDAEDLRTIVQQLVPKTMTNPVSSYLQFPKLPEFSEEPNAAMPNAPADASPSPEVMLDADLPSREMSFQGPSAGESDIYGIPEASESEGWTHQDLSKFRIDVPADEAAGGAGGGNQAFEKYMIPAEELSHAHVEASGDFEEVSFEEVPLTGGGAKKPAASAPGRGGTNPGISRAAIEASAPLSGSGTGGSATNQVLAEKILREEARAVLEKLCWQILPEIAERVVKEEINKLLKSAEKNI